MRRAVYPFAAAVGLEKAQEAVMIALVNPNAGGLLVSGEKGTGKSTLVRAARELIESPKRDEGVEKFEGAEQIARANISDNDGKFANGDNLALAANGAWVEVPISVTEDRLFGSIDSEAAMREGKRKLLAGLIDEANGGVLYIDDANLLREDLLESILSIREAGGFRLERDGLSEWHDARYTVLSVMAPESGTLAKSALDRFGLFVSIEPIGDENIRAEVTRRVLDFERDAGAFRAKFADETKNLREKIAQAKKILKSVEASDAMIRLASVYTLKANVAGHRADIYLIEAARGIAALAGRQYILPKDLERAAEFVLPHRMRKPPEEKTESAPKDAEAPQQQSEPPKNEPQKMPPDELFDQPNEQSKPPTNDTEAHEGNTEPPKDEDSMANPNTESRERVDAADMRVKLPPVWVEPQGRRKETSGSGKRSATKTDEKQGRYVRAEMPRAKTSDIAFDATLRAAAPYQKVREKHGLALAIRPEDIRSKVREKRTGNIFLFVVDASGSMGARERMKTVKGVIFKILLEAYQKRDRVGMIAFRKNHAEVLLPVTRSVDFAQKKLATMPTGGKTPLAKGLSKTEDVLDTIYRQDEKQDPVVFLITDGHATKPIAKGGDAVADAMIEAKRIGRRGLPVAVIDTENGFVKLGLAKKLAREMGASYFAIDKLDENALMRVFRKTAG